MMQFLIVPLYRWFTGFQGGLGGGMEL